MSADAGLASPLQVLQWAGSGGVWRPIEIYFKAKRRSSIINPKLLTKMRHESYLDKATVGG